IYPRRVEKRSGVAETDRANSADRRRSLRQPWPRTHLEESRNRLLFRRRRTVQIRGEPASVHRASADSRAKHHRKPGAGSAQAMADLLIRRRALWWSILGLDIGHS